ncbi:uncharacterized protein LOC129915037 [Episyrphus balteatus]|uniref:uncharacterized protein LOC129915037 n=1 Tax=Episyrphus balteatus TaxID=286459 RepID=UPI0024850E2D|nr:uncharacterized protein LOC129915037 [Episyrphus balteatus]
MALLRDVPTGLSLAATLSKLTLTSPSPGYFPALCLTLSALCLSFNPRSLNCGSKETSKSNLRRHMREQASNSEHINNIMVIVVDMFTDTATSTTTISTIFNVNNPVSETQRLGRQQGGLVLSLSLLVWQLLAANLVYGAAGIVADNYNSAAMGVGDRTYSGGQYASTKDNAVANTLADYLKGYRGSSGSGIGMNDFTHRHDQQQESIVEYHQAQYGSNQNRYGSSGSGGGGGVGGSGGDEQQSHISAGYQPRTYHQSPVSEESEHSYEVPPPPHHHHHQHQSDIDKFGENNFSHQYGQESSESGGGSDGAYHSASGNEGSSSIDYHQNHPELSTSQHQHTDVINYVPYPVVKKVHIPYAKPVQIPISNAILIPIRRPVPIHIPITKQIQVPVERELKIPVEKLVPYPVEKHVPVPVEKHVPYQVVKYVPVKVPKPYAVKVPVVKTVVHKIKQWW